MICTPERGSSNTKRLFSTMANMSSIMTTHLNHCETWLSKWLNMYHSRNHTVGFPRDFFHTGEKCDGSDTDHYMETDAETYSKQLSPTNVIPRSTEYELRHNLELNCNDNNRYSNTNLSWYGTRSNCVHHTRILKKFYGTLPEQQRTYP